MNKRHAVETEKIRQETRLIKIQQKHVEMCIKILNSITELDSMKMLLYNIYMIYKERER